MGVESVRGGSSLVGVVDGRKEDGMQGGGKTRRVKDAGSRVLRLTWKR